MRYAVIIALLIVTSFPCIAVPLQPATRPADPSLDIPLQRQPAFQKHFREALAAHHDLPRQFRALATLLEETGVARQFEQHGKPWNQSDAQHQFLVEQTLLFLIDELKRSGEIGWVDIFSIGILRHRLGIRPEAFAHALVPHFDHPHRKVQALVRGMLEGGGVIDHDVPDVWEALEAYLTHTNAVVNPDILPPGFWAVVFHNNPDTALELTLQLSHAQVRPSPEQERELERIRTYSAAIAAAKLQARVGRDEFFPDPLAFQLLRELAESPRWDVQLYVLTKMSIRPNREHPYFDRDVVQTLARSPSSIVQHRAQMLLTYVERQQSTDHP